MNPGEKVVLLVDRERIPRRKVISANLRLGLGGPQVRRHARIDQTQPPDGLRYPLPLPCGFVTTRRARLAPTRLTHV